MCTTFLFSKKAMSDLSLFSLLHSAPSDTQYLVTLNITLLPGTKCLNTEHRCCEWCYSDVSLFMQASCSTTVWCSCLTIIIYSTCTDACAHAQTHPCTSLSQKEQMLSLSSLTAWLLILLPKYHKTGYNIYNYPHLH